MQTGWLSPSGEFWPCETFDHVCSAEDIVAAHNMPIVTSNFRTSADDILMEHGWVHITRSLLGCKAQAIFWDKHLTQLQKEFLRPYFEENDEPVDMISVMKWEYETDFDLA